jgi:hypothetical protein
LLVLPFCATIPHEDNALSHDVDESQPATIPLGYRAKGLGCTEPSPVRNMEP